MQTLWQRYVARSVHVARDATSRVVRMTGADMPDRSPKTLYTFNSHQDLNAFALGSDSDIGGSSTVNLTLDNGQPTATALFWGTMRLDIKPELAPRYKAGYAGFRSKKRPTIFGEILDDISLHDYLTLRVRVSGEPHTRNSYYVNLRTSGSVTTDIWQHRLYFRKQEEWEDVYIPIRDFVRTQSGHLAAAELAMWTEKVQSVGLSFLGGNNNIQGDYQLALDSIRVVCEQDVVLDGPLAPVPQPEWK